MVSSNLVYASDHMDIDGHQHRRTYQSEWLVTLTISRNSFFHEHQMSVPHFYYPVQQSGLHLLQELAALTEYPSTEATGCLDSEAHPSIYSPTSLTIRDM